MTISTQRNQGSFETAGNLRLFEQWWWPEAEPKAVVIIVHGYAEHSGRYANLAARLTSHGYAVYAFDLRGHGRSEGARAFVWSFEEYLADLEHFLAHVKEREPRKPTFVLGHSMGGEVVALLAATRKLEVRGLVLSGPLLKIGEAVSPLLQRFSLIVGYILPKFPGVKLDSRDLSRDRQVVSDYDNDPLVYRGRMPARTGAEILRATKRINSWIEAITLPLLILHGTADRLADVQGSKQLYARAGSPDKTLKLYQGFYHEVLNEPEKAQVLADLLEWLDAHV